MYSVENSWKNIIPICGNHKEEVIMEINQGPYSMFYACPKYYPQNRSAEERACNNRINLIEYQKMIDHIMGLIAKAEISSGTIDLTHHQWTSKGISYEVIEHTGDNVKVKILNLRAMRL